MQHLNHHYYRHYSVDKEKIAEEFARAVQKAQAQMVEDLLDLKDNLSREEFISLISTLNVDDYIFNEIGLQKDLDKYLASYQSVLSGMEFVGEVTEETLLALVRLDQATFSKQISSMGEQIIDEAVKGILGGKTEREIAQSMLGNVLRPDQADKILRNYTENLNQKYFDKKIDPVIGREEPPIMVEDPIVEEPPMDIPMDNMMIDRPMISGLENPNLFNFDFSNIDMDAINQRIADAGGTIPQDSVMPTINHPAQTRLDAIREARGMPPRIRDNFMSIERMDEPRDEFIPPKRILDEIRIDDRPIIDPRRGMPPPPLPPQDFDFGSGIMPPTPDFLPEEMPMMPNPMPMPMQQRMPMPAPIASPIPSDPMPMAPVDLPRLELPKINRMDRMNVMDRPIPMMPRMGGRGRR